MSSSKRSLNRTPLPAHTAPPAHSSYLSSRLRLVSCRTVNPLLPNFSTFSCLRRFPFLKREDLPFRQQWTTVAPDFPLLFARWWPGTVLDEITPRRSAH